MATRPKISRKRRTQILEAAGVAVMMRGGPSFTHVPEVIRALEHLETSS